MTRRRLSDDLSIDDMVARLVAWYDSASADIRAAGIDWYPAAGDWAAGMAVTTGHTMEAVAAVIAATSPQTRWQDNLADAENVLRGKGKRSGVMGDNVARALRVLEADNPVDELTRGSKTGKRGGPKMFAFASNILGDLDHVTVDTWAARAALGTDGETAGQMLSWVGAYERVADAYRKAAAAAGIPPAVLQATVWIAIRGKAE